MEKIKVKDFRKKLIDDELTLKEWAIQNGWDYDRLKNLLRNVVKPTDEEIETINNYSGVS